MAREPVGFFSPLFPFPVLCGCARGRMDEWGKREGANGVGVDESQGKLSVSGEGK